MPVWTLVAPLVAWLLFFANAFLAGGMYNVALAIVLIGSVLAAVHHAEVIARRVGEPFGILLLAIAVTIMLSFGTGRTTILQGIVVLVLFAVYLFATIFP